MVDPDLMLRFVRELPVITYDTETTGLEWKDRICGYVVSDDDTSLYTPVRHEAGGNIPNVEEFERELALAFADRARFGYRTIGHHLGFDLRMSLKHGIVLGGKLEDTMINESLIDDLTNGYGLDDLGVRYKVRLKKGDELYKVLAERFGGMPDRKQMKNYWRLEGDHPKAVEYACGDGFTTFDVWVKQQPLLDEMGVRVPWQLECDLLPYLARMHIRGMRIDPVYAEKVTGEIGKSIEQALTQFPPGYNPRSPKETEALYRANGYTDGMFATTETGKWSFTEKWLETNEIGKKIVGVRQLENARDKFIKPLIEKADDWTIHPVLHQSKSDEYGVAGARLSCSDPNMQAQPKRNKTVGKIVRPLVIPKPGWLLEEADFMQQEPRFFTHYSEEPMLLEGYGSGTMDIHDAASEILGIPRDYAKRLGLGMLTMMSPKALSGHMGYSIDEARRDHKRFLGGFSHIHNFQKDATAVMMKRGYVRSILGRVARHNGIDWQAYKAVSRIIQNSGGDHMKTALLRACQYEDAYSQYIEILLSIHDSTIWQRDPSHSPKELVGIIENVAHEPQFNLKVPIPVELGSGLHWGEASYGENLKDKKGWVDEREAA